MSSAVTSSAFRRGRSLPSWPAGRPLRAWQQAAAAAVAAFEGDSFLASATPAARKTTFEEQMSHLFLPSDLTVTVPDGPLGTVAILAALHEISSRR